jgi:hypothetical protein
VEQAAAATSEQVAERRMRQAYHAESALKAEGLVGELARELDKTHPGAAASLREGMTETLSILRLDVPPTLARMCTCRNSAPRLAPASPRMSPMRSVLAV